MSGLQKGAFFLLPPIGLAETYFRIKLFPLGGRLLVTPGTVGKEALIDVGQFRGRRQGVRSQGGRGQQIQEAAEIRGEPGEGEVRGFIRKWILWAKG